MLKYGANNYLANMHSKKRLLLVALSVLLLSAGWLRVSGITLLAALVPLMLISHSYDSSRRSFRRMLGWVTVVMVAWCLLTVLWVWFATPVGPIAIVIVQILLFGGTFMLYHYVSKHAPSTLAYVILATGWIAMEYWYLKGQISFPWILLGNGFANDTWSVQWYEYTGIFGGSLWVLLTNILIFHAIVNRSRRTAYWAAGVCIVPMILSLAIFFTYKPEIGGRAWVTLVQPNLDPYLEKFEMPREEQTKLYLSLASEAPAQVDWIVMPETAIDDRNNRVWEHTINEHSVVGEYREFVRRNYPSAQIITGAMTSKLYETPEERTVTARENNGMIYDRFNTALAIDSTAVTQIHHKGKLVVGAEKMPFMRALKPFKKMIVNLGGTTGMLGTDGRTPALELQRDLPDDTIRCGVPICYESVYGEHLSGFVKNGAQIIFVITNDGWWRDTPGYKQHFSYSRLRAIETRRMVCRSANTGISGFIDSRGDVRSTMGWQKRGALTEEVVLANNLTFYVRYGDYIARLSVLVFGLSVLYFIAYRYRRRSHLQK